MATTIDVEQLRELTKGIVRDAAKKDTLTELTKRQIRKQLEKKLSLEDGTLDASEYKSVISSTATDATLEADAPGSNENTKESVDTEDTPEADAAPERKKVTKRKSESEATQAKKKSRATAVDKPKSQKKTKDEPPTKKGKSVEKKSKSVKVVRSASVVPSDSESGGEHTTTKNAAGPKKTDVDADTDVDMADAARESEPVAIDENDHSTSVASTSKASSTAVERSAPAKSNGDKSDSELSVLIDDAPKRGRKKKSSGESTSTKAGKGRGRKPKEPVEDSPQDQEIKRLKSFVVACGVRKMWSKEFKDIADDKSAQIRKLKTILSDLGMTGRLSMEKAKSIREKRELAQELEEVQKFEKTFVSGPRRAKREQVQESEPEEESEAEAAPPKKKMNARMSIMAFLGDQSD